MLCEQVVDGMVDEVVSDGVEAFSLSGDQGFCADAIC